MAWSSEKEAGFALAALLADDRDLADVASTLSAQQHTALASQLALDGDRSAAVRRWLAVLKPPLDERSLQLSARLRAALARLAPPAVRKQLLEGASMAAARRPSYVSDDALLTLLLRLARTPSDSAGARGRS